ncbi:DUF2652 domain-containing protein [Flavobacterium sp. MEB061]|uniref:DUF2652 domain-containing protein n=1 Tax=Flavobacterium sp. MEB061 TaxID=1587524 RepID=UPI000698C7CD|nr:DUF2652 domain-containing protein [Flavobacterium sp. MEB061]
MKSQNSTFLPKKRIIRTSIKKETTKISKSTFDQRGTICIVDISGYTTFVNETQSTVGLLSVSKLLQKIITVNNPFFNISEIEGDAILFYRYGEPYPVDVILQQFEAILLAFNKMVTRLKVYSNNVTSLSLKSIVHYGEISEFTIGRFEKLYGKPLIEAHRLLKNSINRDTYSLITEQYLGTSSKNADTALLGIQQSEKYDVGELNYTYFPY